LHVCALRKLVGEINSCFERKTGGLPGPTMEHWNKAKKLRIKQCLSSLFSSCLWSNLTNLIHQNLILRKCFCLMEQHIYHLIKIHRGHHWKGKQVSDTTFIKLNGARVELWHSLPITECFSCLYITVFYTPLVFLSIFMTNTSFCLPFQSRPL